MYRTSGNEEQLYVMLMRLARWGARCMPPHAHLQPGGHSSDPARRPTCSLLIETIPKHREFSSADPTYVKLRQVREELCPVHCAGALAGRCCVRAAWPAPAAA